MIIQKVAVGALIDSDSRVLITKRPPTKKDMPNLWEFPGGKVKSNEMPDEALIRELNEELSIKTWTSCLAPLTFVIHKYPTFNIILFLFICRRWEGFLSPNEGQEFSWCRKNSLKDYQMPKANSYLVAILRDWI